MSGYTEIALLQYELAKLHTRVAELEEEKKELKALLDFDNTRLDQIEDALEDVEYLGPFVEGIKVLKTQLAALKAENESLRKDAARLDWVEHQDFHDLSFAMLMDQPNDGMIAVSISEGWHLGNNLREAIDKAMEKPND